MTTQALPSASARTDLAVLTRERIMRGLADLLASASGDVTFRALSQASGVPERTIYRHYATKEAVFSEFWMWLNTRLGMPAPPKSPEDLVEQVPVVFAAFEAGEPLVRAMLHDAHGRATRLAHTEARRAKLRDALGDILVALEPADQRRLLSSIQVLFSAAGWENMKDYWDNTSDQAADAAQWAIRALIAQAQRKIRQSGKPAAGKEGRAVWTKRRKG